MTPIAAHFIDLLGVSPLAGIPGGPELWIILFIILILFGRRLPGVARSLGQGISSFKKGLTEPLDEQDAEAEAEAEKKAKDASATKSVGSGEKAHTDS